jgi:hypothetical protein
MGPEIKLWSFRFFRGGTVRRSFFWIAPNALEMVRAFLAISRGKRQIFDIDNCGESFEKRDEAVLT